MKAKKEKITFSIEKDLRERLEELWRVQVMRNVDKGEKLSSFSRLLEKVLVWGLESKGKTLYEAL